MQSCKTYLCSAVVLALFAPPMWAQSSEKKEEKKIVVRRIDQATPAELGATSEKEKVTFLGVETAPVTRPLSSQLGLPRETGLIVTRIAADSPAAAVLKEDDVLLKFEDQLLVNMPQLGTLVRAKPDGAEVKLTLMRAGKEIVVTAKLTSREMPKLAQMEFFQTAPGFNWSGSGPDLEQLRNLPGMGPEQARDVLRIIGRERGNVINAPRLHIRSHGGQGSTILDLPRSNISFSDDEGSIEIKSENEKRTLTVKDPAGKVLFEGPYGSPEERKKVPADIAKRLQKLDVETLNFEAGADFEAEVVPLPPATTRTKIGHELPRTFSRGSRPF